MELTLNVEAAVAQGMVVALTVSGVALAMVIYAIANRLKLFERRRHDE